MTPYKKTIIKTPSKLLGLLLATSFVAAPAFAQYQSDNNRGRDNRGGWSERDNRDNRGNLGEGYRTYIADRNSSSIDDFKIVARNFRPGNTIEFFVEAESGARNATVQFKANRNQRTVALKKDAQGRFVGSYKISPSDNLSDDTEFNLKLANRRGINSYATLVPPGGRYQGSERDAVASNDRADRNDRGNGRDRDNRYDNNRGNNMPPPPMPMASNANMGQVVAVNSVPGQADNVNVGGAALGAIAGGILGNQVGKGNGNKAATVIGAIGGGLAGNHIGKNMSNSNTGTTWLVDVRFNDGSAQRFQYPQDPQVNVGQRVQRDPNVSGGLILVR